MACREGGAEGQADRSTEGGVRDKNQENENNRAMELKNEKSEESYGTSELQSCGNRNDH